MMSSSRKPPHCRTCHKPLKGHKRGRCELLEPLEISALPSVQHKTRKSNPLPVEVAPTLSSQSSEILNSFLRSNSFSVPLPTIQTPVIRSSVQPRRSGRLVVKHEKTLREQISSSPERGQVSNNVDHLGHISRVPTPVKTLVAERSACVTSQEFNTETSDAQTLEPLEVTMSHQLKLEGSSPSPQHFEQSPSDISFTDPTIHNFLDRMTYALHPPATMFSFPKNGVKSLEDTVQSRGLRMHVLSFSNSKSDWVPVVIGQDMDAVAKLLEDGEKLAQGLRRPGKFGIHELDLGISHIVVGALGALATWAGLAYC